MASVQIIQPYQTFEDRNGDPLDGGYIYVGQPNLNPEVFPIQVFFDSDLTIPAAQPIRTVGGYPSRNGSPASIYAAQTYSITVRDSNGTLVFGKLNTSGDINDSVLALLSDSSTFENGAGLVALYGAVAGRSVQTALENRRYVEDFGETGLGNDTATLLLAFAWLQAEPGRTLEFKAGATYIQGPGPNSVTYEGNPYFPCRFDFSDQDNMTILGNGATIEADPTLADNQFNRGFNFLRCNNLTIMDLTYDGRLDARTPFGGDAFNGGNELTGNIKNGFQFVRCYDFTLIRCNSNRTMMDGFHPSYEFGFPGVDSESKRGVFINCSALQNYRQGMSIVGMSYGLVVGGSYSQTGTIPGKGVNPMAGIDIEANEDNAAKRCSHNTFIGVELSQNRQGMAFALGAQSNEARNCKFVDNRLYGVSFALASCKNNKVVGGRIDQFSATTESATRCATIGREKNGLVGVEINFATPHRGVEFENSTTCIDGFIERCTISDVAPATDVTSLPFGIFMSQTAIRQYVAGNTIRNVTGTGFAVTVDGADSRFVNGNYVVSAYGESGARGVNVIAGECHGNTGSGTKTSTAIDAAVFNQSGVATTIKQLGPNVDIASPRLGQKVRRVNFAAGPYYFTGTVNPPSLAAGGVHTVDVSIPGVRSGDHYLVSVFPGGIGLVGSGTTLADDSARIRFVNESGGVLDAPLFTYNVTVIPG